MNGQLINRGAKVISFLNKKNNLVYFKQKIRSMSGFLLLFDLMMSDYFFVVSAAGAGVLAAGVVAAVVSAGVVAGAGAGVSVAAGAGVSVAAGVVDSVDSVFSPQEVKNPNAKANREIFTKFFIF
jgi:hypothetical protein